MLPCCDAAHSCFAGTSCFAKPSRQGCFDPQADEPRCKNKRLEANRSSAPQRVGSDVELSLRATDEDEPRCRSFSAALPTPPQPAHGRGCFPMRGKYWDEMHDAVLHWRYLQCAAPRYWPSPSPSPLTTPHSPLTTHHSPLATHHAGSLRYLSPLRCGCRSSPTHCIRGWDQGQRSGWSGEW